MDGEVSAVVVRAEDEAAARALAAEEENRLRDRHGYLLADPLGYTPHSSGGFLDIGATTCAELTAEGGAAVVCCDFYEP